VLLKQLVALGIEKPSLYRINIDKPDMEKPVRFIRNWLKCFIFSGVIVAAGLTFMIVNAVNGKNILNYDVEFTGGLSIEFDMGADFANADVSSIISRITGQTNPQVYRITGTNHVSVKMQSIETETMEAMREALKERFPEMDENPVSLEDISASISGEMQRTAFGAVIIVCVLMLLYIAIRFRDVRMGGASVLMLIHDALIMIAAYAILRINVNYSFIAVLLTVLGYSINSTIIVFDRVRENKKLLPNLGITDLIDKSLTQSFTRTVYTTITTLMTIVCLAVIGVPSVREFAIPIIIGISFGAYSSLCIAGAIWYSLSKAGKKKAAR
jgi:preprotein translocase SecF subunit